MLGCTGAGLQCSEVEPGSKIQNLIGKPTAPRYVYHLTIFFFYLDELMEDFPYWERLRGYWRTLPNFNPLTVTSEPGQDLEADALKLFERGHSQPPSDHLWDLELEGDKSTPVPTISGHDGLSVEEQAEMDADPDADGDEDAMGEDDEVCFKILPLST